MSSINLPDEGLSIEDIIQSMENATTSDGFYHTANCAEASLPKALANPQTEELSQRIISFHYIMEEARKRYQQIKLQEISRINNDMDKVLNSWGVTRPEIPFTPVKARKSTEQQSAKKARTDDATCRNRFIMLTIQENDEPTEMEAIDTIPMPSPPASPRRSPRPTTPSVPRRKMVLPIAIDNVQNASALLKILQNLTKIKLTAKLTDTNLRIYPQTAYAYHTIRRRNCLVVGDLNAKHTPWNPTGNNQQGKIHYNFAKKYHLNINAPEHPPWKFQHKNKRHRQSNRKFQ
ncbi:hypothetical protein NPIL_523451 [Nephila pilipes]|uniref:Endonuclease/exonuclease/phosphatase domain-containing protein n=1 Tax=Nephila pilipes TaxID=299642 RepID=A0A8X6M8L6_NEPPI|nr:hypothetical protein NPIL_178351 [Nephila pilipes]GFT84557.1 hypothetical protein NPIL_523451 [Nephila pilipes]